MENKIWMQTEYQDYLEKLILLQDEKYRKFHEKLTTTKYPILGINVPSQRKIAQKISKTDILSFLSFVTNTYYEEVMIEGFVIANIMEEALFFEYFEKYLPKIDNWAICDGFCNSLKIVAKQPEKYFEYFLNLLKKEEPFTIRVGLITLLSFYMKEEYIEKILEQINQITSSNYYVNMGQSWLLAEIYIHNDKKVKEFLEHTNWNDFTVNKTISKIRESYRVTKEQKEEMLKYKRRKEKC